MRMRKKRATVKPAILREILALLVAIQAPPPAELTREQRLRLIRKVRTLERRCPNCGMRGRHKCIADY